MKSRNFWPWGAAGGKFMGQEYVTMCENKSLCTWANEMVCTAQPSNDEDDNYDHDDKGRFIIIIINTNVL